MARPALTVSIFCAFAAWIATCLLATPVLAQQKNNTLAPAQYSAEVGLGGEYDSNVSVEEVDRATNQGDYAMTMDVGLEAQKELSRTIKVAATYDFSQVLYKEFSRVDRQTHILGTDLALDLDRVDTGISFYYINSRLDNDKFLELYRVSPSVSGFLAKKWFARGAYVYSNKSIENRPGRDANTNAGEVDLYYFHRGLRSYFNLGYRYKDEDADANRLDYTSNSLKLRYIHRFEIFSRIAKLELAWRYEDRNYSTITPSIGEDRDDQRHRWRADFEMPIIGRSAVQVYYGYANYDSNYPSADYTQNLFGTRFLYRW
ncbi:MAG: hypothetical protein DRR04_04540 [Gammaproteobacteria bacterium]|nr:MAG: hypothetical protein DRQ97_07315 [Gammaproteobacteria bacterium]RLA60857.1 MAG: hypothetical protein DRR04_04540 [Gammaproteobacteria bacterium]